MLSVSARVAAAQRTYSRLMISPPVAISKPFWKGASLPLKQATRSYIFLPSNIDDVLKLIKSQSSETARIMVKLSSRWQDQLGTALDRYDKLLRQTSSNLLYNMKPTQAVQSQTGSSKTMTKYKSLKTWGMNRLVTHYNAKKRVFASRRKAFRRYKIMNGPDKAIYREQFYNQKKMRLHQGLTQLRAKIERKRLAIRDWLINGRNTNLAITNGDQFNCADGASTRWKSLTLTEPSQQSWFDEEGYPLTSREDTGRFVNPWGSQSTNGENGFINFIRWKTEGLFGRSVSTQPVQDNNRVPKSIYREGTSPYTRAKHFTDSVAEQTIKLAWLGHATTLIHFPGNFTILTDPHFSNYAGPMKRNDPPPMSVSDLPSIDCVMISHDHMDHLDYWSTLELVDSNKVNFWVVPLGIKDWLIRKAGINPETIIELEWWEGVRFSKDVVKDNELSSLSKVEGLFRAFDKTAGQTSDSKHKSQSDRHELSITCAPAQHWCSRTPFDRNHRLWCSFAVHATPSCEGDSTRRTSQSHSFYFAGDTGLPNSFPLHHQIGDRLGPFDLAAIPIGAYEPRWFMKESHCDPSEAVEIHQAIRSRRSVAIHFDTFNLADEPQEEPPRLLVEEVDRLNEQIGRLAAEVEAVADEIKIVVRDETPNPNIEKCMDSSKTNLSHQSKDFCETKTMAEFLPPLVDFAVIHQGHFIESSPKE